MSHSHGKREFGRGERVLPGLWRLRLTLPLPGVPHCNAWAIQSGDGIVLVDCGMHEAATADQPSSMAQLENALAQVNLRLEQVRHLVITHAHSDHWGQAGPVIDRSGAELWMHPDHAHSTEPGRDPEAALARLLEIGRQSGVPEDALQTYTARRREMPSGVARFVDPDHDLVEGVEIATDLGSWHVYETPGHAPSHVCLHQPERRILICGDHLLGRVTLYFDYGWTPDPIDEFVRSLDKVDRLDARLALSGHGRPFTDVHGHVSATRELVTEQLARTHDAVIAAGPEGSTALQAARVVFGDLFTSQTAPWLLNETLCFLTHLSRTGEIALEDGDPAQSWHAVD